MAILIRSVICQCNIQQLRAKLQRIDNRLGFKGWFSSISGQGKDCEGMKMQGWPTITLCRGRVIVDEGTFVGEAGYGLFMKRPF